MDWLAHVPPLAIGALVVSLILAVVTFSLTTSGHRMETPDGLGGKRTYSRGELAALPPLFVGVGIYLFIVSEPAGGNFRTIGGLWIFAVLVSQGWTVVAALQRRRDRAQRRKDLFGQ